MICEQFLGMPHSMKRRSVFLMIVGALVAPFSTAAKAMGRTYTTTRTFTATMHISARLIPKT
jgi:hypothetical protein